MEIKAADASLTQKSVIYKFTVIKIPDLMQVLQ